VKIVPSKEDRTCGAREAEAKTRVHYSRGLSSIFRWDQDSRAGRVVLPDHERFAFVYLIFTPCPFEVEMKADHLEAFRQRRRTLAFRFVVLLGVVSFFADATYEGGRSLLGPFLLVLGAGPLTVGLVAGAGEFLGYAVRYPAGLWAQSERSRRLLLYVGYFVNLVALPLLAFVHRIGWAVALLLLERLGRGVRAPAKKTLLAGAGDELGSGRVFGLHEAFDQLGAVIGPLFVATTLAGGYARAFSWLFVPAVAAAVVLVVALKVHDRGRIKSPGAVKESVERAQDPKSRSGFFWLCVFAGALIMGLAPMILFGYTLVARGGWSGRSIAMGFAWAMAVSALGALVFGRLYDRYGSSVFRFLLVLVPATMLMLSFRRPTAAYLVLGLTGWGLSVGAMEGTLHAAVARYAATASERGRLFGIFDASFGASWMVGGVLIGWLERSRTGGVFLFSLACSVVAAYALHRQNRVRQRAP
jgi:hypothetical protein